MQYATVIAKGGMSMLKGLQTVKAGREQAYKLELESEQDEIATISAEADRKYDLTKDSCVSGCRCGGWKR